MTTTMHFGPEWMRTKHQVASRPQPPPSPPPSSVHAQQNASTYSALVSPAPSTEAENRDETHPFRYSKEEMLRIYKEGGGKGGLGLEVERWEGVVREVGSDPIGLREMGDGEKKLFTGSVNSDLRRRQSTDYLSPLSTPALGGDRPRLNRENSNPASPMRDRFGSLMTRRRDSTDPPSLPMPRRQSLSSGQGPVNSPRDPAPSPRTRVGYGPGFDGVLSGGDSWVARRKAAEGLSRTTSASRADPGSELDTKAIEIKEEEEAPSFGTTATSMDDNMSHKSNGIHSTNEALRDPAIQPVNQAPGDHSMSGNSQYASSGEGMVAFPTSGHPPPPPNHIDLANVEWSYLDPQGNVQGPFIADVMQKWYDGGYFTPDLLMKRTHTDNDWIPVGELARRTGGGKIFLTPPIASVVPPGLGRQTESPLLGYAQYDPNTYNPPYQPVPTRSLRTSTLDSYIAASSNSSPSSSFGAGRFSNGSPDPAAFGGRVGGNVYPTDARFPQAPGPSYNTHRGGFHEQPLDPSLGRSGGYVNLTPGRASSVDTYGYHNGYNGSPQAPWVNPTNTIGSNFDGPGRAADTVGTYSPNTGYPISMNAPVQFNQHDSPLGNERAPVDVFSNPSTANATFVNGAGAHPMQSQNSQTMSDVARNEDGGGDFAAISNGVEDLALGSQQYTQSPTLHYAAAVIPPQPAVPSPTSITPSHGAPANVPLSPWANTEPVPARRAAPFDAAHPKATNTVVPPVTPSATSPWGPTSATSQPVSQAAEASPWFQASQGGTIDDNWAEQKIGPNSLTVDNLGVHNQQHEAVASDTAADATNKVQSSSLIQPQIDVAGISIPPSASIATVVPSVAPSKPKRKLTQTQPTIVTQPPVSIPADEPSPPTQSKPAWATEEDKKKLSTGLGLREIQEAEAKKLEARKAAERERAARLAASVTPVADDAQSFTASWGLPTSRAGARTDTAKEATSSPAGTPATNGAVWTNNGKPSQAKKTMKEIQEEEERRKKAAVKETAAAAAARRGYADTTNKSPSSVQPVGGAWTTVGATGKISAAAPTVARPATVTSTPTPSAPGSSSIPRSNTVPTSRIVAVPKPTPRVEEASVPPSHDFLQWLSGSLKGLNTSVNLEDIVSMLLSFPMDPDPSTVEIITELIYANSTTLDGRRFASEFVNRRKTDAASRRGASVVGKPVSIADVVRTQPKPTQPEWGGFKVVNKKKKGGRV